ncbi:MAG: MarR family transcriptional regulator [Acidobacteriota bacterium]
MRQSPGAIFARMVTKAQLKSLQASRRYGIGRLLLLARRDFLSRLAQIMHIDGDLAVQARGRLLPYIDIEGTRSTDLARRIGVSKQAVARMVKELEEEGLLFREGDEVDGRAQLIKFTESGLKYLTRMHAVISQVEDDYEQLVGTDAMNEMRTALATIAYEQSAIQEDGSATK